jgi:hypothetical protein
MISRPSIRSLLGVALVMVTIGACDKRVLLGGTMDGGGAGGSGGAAGGAIDMVPPLAPGDLAPPDADAGDLSFCVPPFNSCFVDSYCCPGTTCQDYNGEFNVGYCKP